MQLVAVGIDQGGAPLAHRERLAFAPADLPAALGRLRDITAEGFILSTCNRTEIWAVAGHADTGARALVRFLADERGLSPGAVRPHLRECAHEAAVARLFRVAAGLESMVLGEDQILGQVKAALDAAAAADALGPTLHRLGQLALATGKRVRTETALGRDPVSVVSVALRLAAGALGDLRGRAALIVGAGPTAELALKHLADGRRAPVAIVNRSRDAAAALAARYGARVLPWDDLEGALAAADLVISCTAAPAPVIDAATVARALARRPARPLLALDLAVPRDIAPAAGAVPGVTLHDLDALEAVSAAGRRRRAAEAAAAEAIVAAEAARFLGWWRAREVAPAIAALRGQAEAIRDAEVARALARLPGLNPREAEVVRALAGGIVNKLLHRPVTRLKADPEGANMARVVHDLFGLPRAGDPVEVAPVAGADWPAGLAAPRPTADRPRPAVD
jgi:glutamyl-tRNA reductase